MKDLILACYRGFFNMAKSMIEKSADVNYIDYDGDTPLMYACRNGHIDIVKLLLEKGADVNYIKTKDGNTALTNACTGGHIDIIKLLLENGADTNHKNNWEYDSRGDLIHYGMNALDIAVKKEDKELVKILILHEMKFKEIMQKNSNESIDIYEILINKIKEKAIVKDIIKMKQQLELL